MFIFCVCGFVTDTQTQQRRNTHLYSHTKTPTHPHTRAPTHPPTASTARTAFPSTTGARSSSSCTSRSPTTTSSSTWYVFSFSFGVGVCWCVSGCVSVCVTGIPISTTRNSLVLTFPPQIHTHHTPQQHTLPYQVTRNTDFIEAYRSGQRPLVVFNNVSFAHNRFANAMELQTLHCGRGTYVPDTVSVFRLSVGIGRGVGE